MLRAVLEVLAGPANTLLLVTFAVVEAGLLGWAVGTYWQLDAIRWYLTRLVPVAVLVHVAVLPVAIVGGAPPGKDLYLVGMLLGLFVGLPVVTVGTWYLQRHFDRRFRAKPADLRQLEQPRAERVHPVLDPTRQWRPGRIDASTLEVSSPLERTTDPPEDPLAGAQGERPR